MRAAISRSWCRFLGVAAVAILIAGCGGGGEPAPPPPPPTSEDVDLGVPPPPTEEEMRVWARPSSLQARSGLEPGIHRRLSALETDYFNGDHVYVISSSEQLLDMIDDGPGGDELRLRLYYLLARSHARNRSPREARRYEQLFKDLFTRLHGEPPRDAAAQGRLSGALDRSESLHHEVHPNWTRDPDGTPWVNVRLQRLLERAGPVAVLSEPHPGGGTVHFSREGERLQEFLEAEGLASDANPVQRDQRFGFYYFMEEEAR